MQKKNTLSSFLVLLIVLFATVKSNAQQVKINATDQPLNKVLIEMGKNYNVQFSFNDRLLSECFISDNKTYDSPKQAITELVKTCELTFKINEGVFVIYKPVVLQEKSKRLTVKGIVVDAINGEPLPFSNIQINTIGLTTDVNGNFSFKSKDSTLHIKVSHVGYYLKDTLISNKSNIKIKLAPSIVGLEEFIVESQAEIRTATIGERPGLVKVNAKVAQFLPGNRSNTVFNILRLQPGILAAGEQTNDYMVWSSYKGQTQLVFDGITLFNIGSANDHIGAVNPFIVKDVEVYKGGYNVHLGDRTGGVVNITGTSGNRDKIGAQVSIDNQLTNAAINLPIGEKNALQIMFRKSYFDLININNSNSKENAYTIDQKFVDGNIKLSGFGDNGDQYYISLLGNQDQVAYDITDEKNDQFAHYHKSDQEQFGGAIFYGKSWKRVGTTNFTIAHSNLNINSNDSRQYTDSLKTATSSISSTVENGVTESSLKIEHHFPTSHKQTWMLGFGLTNNETKFVDEIKSIETDANRINGFLKNDISISKKISIEPGIRIDVPLNTEKFYLQPRMNVILRPFQYWKINLAAGIYNQFLVENPIFDSAGNTYNNWGIADEKLVPVVKGVHYVSGISFSKNDFTVSAEGFYKTNDNLSRFTNDFKSSGLNYTYGESRSIGVDFFIKKKISKHQFWMGYTISKTEELFLNFATLIFQPAPHDQRHELKAAGLFNFDPVYFSVNYVYGSGLINSEQLSVGNKIIPYNRFDAALLYRFNTKKYKLEAGVSVLNVFNTFNVRYNNFSSFPNSQTVYQQALPITPTILIKFSF